MIPLPGLSFLVKPGFFILIGVGIGAWASSHLSSIKTQVLASALATTAQSVGTAVAANQSLSAALDELEEQNNINAAAYASALNRINQAAAESIASESDATRVSEHHEELTNGWKQENSDYQTWGDSLLPDDVANWLRANRDGSGGVSATGSREISGEDGSGYGRTDSALSSPMPGDEK